MQGINYEEQQTYFGQIANLASCVLLWNDQRICECIQLGAQIAKNLVLMKPKRITLYDTTTVKKSDVQRNYMCRQSDIGIKTRAELCCSFLKTISQGVQIDTLQDSSIDRICQQYDCVVVVDYYDRQYLFSLSNQVHKKGKAFFWAGSLALYGFVFVDLGENHCITDQTGEQQQIFYIKNIKNDELGTIYLSEQKHSLQQGEEVLIQNVEGMHEVNHQYFKVKVSPYFIAIGNTCNHSKYIRGGTIKRVKKSIKIAFEELKQQFKPTESQETFNSPIKAKLGQIDYITLNSLFQLYSAEGKLPALLNVKDSQRIKIILRQQVQCFSKQSEKQFNPTDSFLKNICQFSQIQLAPCSSFWGGVVAQEIIKVTGKFNPVHQWLTYDFTSILNDVPDQNSDIAASDYSILFGKQFQQNMNKCNCLLVGAGAIGCQLIKIIAQMNLSLQGTLTISDQQNLAARSRYRKWMFSKEDVGKNKSEVACRWLKEYSPNYNIKCCKLKINKQSENYFDDIFWENLDLVISAVDSTSSRYYCDSKCVWFQKPVIDVNTSNNTVNCSVVLPFSTKSLSDYANDEPSGFTDYVKIRGHFPYNWKQNTQFAVRLFESCFQSMSKDLRQILKKQFDYKKIQQYEKVQNLRQILLCQKVFLQRSFKYCVWLSLRLFQSNFNDGIQELINYFPAEHRTEDGVLFWSGLKRHPISIAFDIQDSLHINFILSAANIFASMLNIDQDNNRSKIVEMLSTMQKYNSYFENEDSKSKQVGRPSANADFSKSKQFAEIIKQSQDLRDKRLKQSMHLRDKTLNQTQALPNPINFVPINPNKNHMEFIWACTNLRSRVYRLQEVSLFTVEKQVCRIASSLPTSTASAAGLAALQIIKFCLKKQVKQHTNTFASLAEPFFFMSQPESATLSEDNPYDPAFMGPVLVIPEKFDKWQKINIKGPMTVRNFKLMFQDRLKIIIDSIYCFDKFLYSTFNTRLPSMLDLQISEAIAQVLNQPLSQSKKYVQILIFATDDNQIDCLIPSIRYERS